MDAQETVQIEIDDKNEKKELKKEHIISNEIICSECKESCFIDIKDYNFTLFGCKNNHNVNNISIENFEKTQKIQNLKKICQKCNKNTKEYYKCLNCSVYFCSKCKLEHIKEHKIIENEKINYICNEHYEIYTKYCIKCNKNLCIQCEKEHKNHENIYFGDILPNNINKENEKLKELKECIDKLNNEVNERIEKLKFIMRNLKLYYDISNSFINNYNNNNRNYQNLKNINQFIKYNSIIIKDIKNAINDSNTTYNKYSNLMDIYYKIKNIKYSNYIISQIDIKENDINKEIRIINDKSIVYKGLFSEEIDEIDNEQIKKYCEIKVNDKLIPFSYYYKFQEKGKYIMQYSFNSYLTKINGMFFKCDKLNKIDMSHFNTNEVTDISFLFYECRSLNELNLSNLNTENVINMEEMFSHCGSLNELNLSNFKTEKVTNMDLMFSYCNSLKELNLTNFNTKKVKYMCNIFEGCKSLKKEKVITNDKKLINEFGNCIIY